MNFHFNYLSKLKQKLSEILEKRSFRNSLCDTFPGLTITSESMINYRSYSKGPSVSTEESDSAAAQIPKGSLHIIQGSEQIGLVTGDPVQLQVQKGYAWGNPPAPQEKHECVFFSLPGHCSLIT